MRIAITTDQDFVSSCFGCGPACTIYDIKDGKIQSTFVVPNPSWNHREWADFLQRNSVTCLIVGNIGANAQATLKWRGIQVISGVDGSTDDVIDRYLKGTLLPGKNECADKMKGRPSSACGSSETS
jgi:predicted Fe-Mo cluster-binding NifX family protein